MPIFTLLTKKKKKTKKLEHDKRISSFAGSGLFELWMVCQITRVRNSDFTLHLSPLCLCRCGMFTLHICMYIGVCDKRQTCSLMLLMPSGPSRFTACLTRSVRPQLSILKPRSCRNLASVEAASSFLVAQKQSSALQMETTDPLLWLSGSLSQKWILRSVDIHLHFPSVHWGKVIIALLFTTL